MDALIVSVHPAPLNLNIHRSCVEQRQERQTISVAIGMAGFQRRCVYRERRKWYRPEQGGVRGWTDRCVGPSMRTSQLRWANPNRLLAEEDGAWCPIEKSEPGFCLKNRGSDSYALISNPGAVTKTHPNCRRLDTAK